MNWKEILAATAVQAALIAALGFLARSIIIHWLSKDLAGHKNQLEAQSQLAMEAFKNDLAQQTLEHRVRFETLHSHQVAAIEALYVQLVEARHVVESFVHAWRAENEAEFRRVGGVFLDRRAN